MSILSGAHMTLLPRIMGRVAIKGLTDVRRSRRRHDPENGHPSTQSRGNIRIRPRNVGLSTISPTFASMPAGLFFVVTSDDVLARLHGADRRALPRLATLVENGDPRGIAALDAIYPLTGAAHRVGVTGPPGAGKSTLWPLSSHASATPTDRPR